MCLSRSFFGTWFNGRHAGGNITAISKKLLCGACPTNTVLRPGRILCSSFLSHGVHSIVVNIHSDMDMREPARKAEIRDISLHLRGHPDAIVFLAGDLNIREGEEPNLLQEGWPDGWRSKVVGLEDEEWTWEKQCLCIPL